MAVGKKVAQCAARYRREYMVVQAENRGLKR